MSSTNSQVFLDDLNHIAQTYIANYTDPALQAAYLQIPNTPVFNGSPITPVTLFSTFFNPDNINTANSNDTESFINSFYKNVLNFPSIADIQALPYDAYDPTDPQSPLNGLYNVFLKVMGYDPSYPDLNLVQNANLPGQFKAMFSDFLKNFPFQVLTSLNSASTTQITVSGIEYAVNIKNNYENFFKAYARYLSTTSVVQTTSLPQFITNLFTDPNNNNYGYVQSYQTIYESFNGPIGTLSNNPNNWTVAQQVFVNRFAAFYVAKLAKTSTAAEPTGFFDTSQNLPDWYNFSQNLYYNPQFSPTAIIANPRSTIILDEVLRSLIAMIGVIQTVAAAQSNSLNFLSHWQLAYTNKLNQIHTFAQGDGTVLGTRLSAYSDGKFPPTILFGNQNWDENGQNAVRNSLNSINQSYISKLQANQQNISDNAKSLQSNVNQSLDAANQQGSVADSILSELSTILSSIFR